MPRHNPNFTDVDIVDNFVFRNLVTDLYLEIERFERQFGEKPYLHLLKTHLSRVYMVIVLSEIQQRS